MRTLSIRALSPHFEHKLFLSATPHNEAQVERFPALDENVLDDKQKFEDLRPAVSQFVDSGTINQEAAGDEYAPVKLPKPNWQNPAPSVSRESET
jgi:hypothetical protein